MMTEMRIEQVIPGSIADEIGICAGDFVVDIESQRDILDWQLAESSELLLLTIKHQDGQLVEYEIEKIMIDLGHVFGRPPWIKLKLPQQMRFCFVDQMPPKMQDTLYVKDDIIAFLSDGKLYHINQFTGRRSGENLPAAFKPAVRIRPCH